MNTLELDGAMKLICQKRCKYFVGAIDQLPTKFETPMAIISNTDISVLPGTHWLGLYFFNNNNINQCIFIDSFGKSPKYYGL